MIFTGEICRYCARPITVDDKNPQVARCRKCGAPFHTQCWFAANEKCSVPGCDGKASDIGAPKIKDPVGDVCPFLPPDPPRREGGDPTPARCVRVKCMLYDAVEKRCGLGEIAYTLATVRDSGRQTRHLLHQAVGSSSKQTVHLLTTLTNTMRSTEKEIKGLNAPQAAQVKSLGAIAELLVKVSGGIDALSSDWPGSSRPPGSASGSGRGAMRAWRRGPPSGTAGPAPRWRC